MDNNEILRHIIEIKENQAASRTEIKNLVESIKDVTPRVDKLEKKAVWVSGASSAAGFLGGILSWFISHAFRQS